MTKLIAMNGVGFGYPEQTPILSGVNFEINQGDRISVLGPNGSGKSTMALLVAGLIAPAPGEILRFHNRSSIGIVFQNSRQQMVGSTVEDDLAFGLSLRKIPAEAIKCKVEIFLSKFNLTAKRDRNINHLSGGELRRLALASVLITEPQILILDEPLTMLDKANQRSFLSCLNGNVPPETAIIWFDHEVRSIRYNEKWMVLSKGRLTNVSINDLNSKAFLELHSLTPAPLQPLEWAVPEQISGAIYGPERITFDRS